MTMKYYFFIPDFGQCTVRLWARGAYGFTAPKRIEISTPGGRRTSYSYRTLHEVPGVQLSGKVLMRLAIAQFLANPIRCDEIIELDSSMPMFDGPLHRPAGWPRVGPIGRLPSA
jgi:hypothetical protein